MKPDNSWVFGLTFILVFYQRRLTRHMQGNVSGSRFSFTGNQCFLDNLLVRLNLKLSRFANTSVPQSRYFTVDFDELVYANLNSFKA